MVLVKALDEVPRFLCIFAPVEDVEVVRGDDTLVYQSFEVDDLGPEVLAEQQDW